MVGRKRPATRSSARRAASAAEPTGGEIYLDMLAEAGVNPRVPSSPERPLKRRRATPKKPVAEVIKSPEPSPKKPEPQAAVKENEEEDEDEDEDIEFEDVALPQPTMQTMELESDDEDDDEDIIFEDVDFTAPLQDKPEEPTSLELNLSAQQSSTAQAKKAVERRKPISKEERKTRIDVHKAHLLCLLAHAARRNHWCNDGRVQDFLRPHLTDKTVNYLTPGAHLPQFGRTESLKTGLKQAESMWKTKYEVNERGLRRALWAEDPKQLEDVCKITQRRFAANQTCSMSHLRIWKVV
jgi:xeroderma pigmentosum group C-complementing protein